MDRFLKSALLLVAALILLLAPQVSANQVDHSALTKNLRGNLISLPAPVGDIRTREVSPVRTAAPFASVIAEEFSGRTGTPASRLDAPWSGTEEPSFFRDQTYVDRGQGTALARFPGNRFFEGWGHGHLKTVQTSNPAIATPEPPALVLLLAGLAAVATVLGLKKGAH